MATSIHPSIHQSLSCLLPFYTIPIFPLLNRKIFHVLVYSAMLCAAKKERRQVNEKSFDLKEGWYKREGDKTGMNDACYHGDDLLTLTINRHMPYIVTADQVVYVTVY